VEQLGTSARGSLPAQFRLDVSVAPGNAREFELLRYGMAPFYAIDAACVRERASFGTTMTSYQFADIAIAGGHSSAATFERTAQTIARSASDNISLVIYSKGGCSLDVEGRSSDVHPGDVFILDKTRPNTVRAPAFSSVTVVLPRALLELQLADVDRLHGLVLKRSAPLNAMLVGHVQTWFAQAPQLSMSDARAIAQGATAMVAAFAGASELGREKIRIAAATTSLQRARHVIEKNLPNRDLDADFLCKQLGMSRSKLYRLFEPAGGVGQYVLRRRMMRAYKHTMDPALAHERIGAIAARCGFANVSVFNRSFRQAHGASPTELRNTLAQAPADLELSFDNDFEIMSRWLLGL
jgi:AraC-like DNA-binding protein